jgi:hypothetical protein
MKNLILNNLPAKIISLAIASVLWFAIKRNVETTSLPTNAGKESRLAPRVETNEIRHGTTNR